MNENIYNLIELNKLINSNKISDSTKILDIYINCVFSLTANHHNDEVDFIEQKFVKLIPQMIFTKLSNIKKSLKGIEFNNNDFILKPIIDANTIANDIRNLCEIICLFNNFFSKNPSEEEVKFKLNIWEHSSLKYRLKLKNTKYNSDKIDLLEADDLKIKELFRSIESSPIYLNLDDLNKKKIEDLLRKKDYKFIIDNKNIKILDWQQLIDNFPDNNKALSMLYTLLSFYSHPSYKSVKDFGISFSHEKVWTENVQDFLRYSYYLTSIFIVDYINYFPKTKSTFSNLENLDKQLIEFFNFIIRGENFLIDKNIFK